MQADLTKRYALASAADARRYVASIQKITAIPYRPKENIQYQIAIVSY
jgi:hypothetical protein